MCASNQIICGACLNKESLTVCLDKSGFCPRCGWGLKINVPKQVKK